MVKVNYLLKLLSQLVLIYGPEVLAEDVIEFFSYFLLFVLLDLP